ncbi:YhcH/YjgK/YiaL family protein [Paenibacillus doosanensis]|uniref:YhcH/YjgK/YiaL family protein n=1 Tax=Paenibacillus doosanensis TaxID=1229154 RepID=UPI00217F7004|nr:YhcH/YjgK/YiaL family protein [Paenibacillus doosanensis]MCS7464800.1 YhcH/YjgK/YiaL family protein [Paenibacillus doosanensis]
MLVGSLNEGMDGRFGIHPAIAKALDFLQATDFRLMDNGKYAIDGERMYVNIMELISKPGSGDETDAEKHRRYIDIHYLLEGEETIGWAFHREGMIPSQVYDEEQDYALYRDAADERYIDLSPGMYVILFPNELHRPGLCKTAPMPIRKAVVKIEASLLERR